jgi:hypothetical protein
MVLIKWNIQLSQLSKNLAINTMANNPIIEKYGLLNKLVRIIAKVLFKMNIFYEIELIISFQIERI